MPNEFEDITLSSFGIVWQIWWLAAVGALTALANWIARSFQRETERIIPAPEIERVHRAWLETVRHTAPAPREWESTPANHGLAEGPAI